MTPQIITGARQTGRTTRLVEAVVDSFERAKAGAVYLYVVPAPSYVQYPKSMIRDKFKSRITRSTATNLFIDDKEIRFFVPTYMSGYRGAKKTTIVSIDNLDYFTTKQIEIVNTMVNARLERFVIETK